MHTSSIELFHFGVIRIAIWNYEWDIYLEEKLLPKVQEAIKVSFEKVAFA